MDPGETSGTRSGLSVGAQARAWLVLARGSNLPTVWSNCLAACWLGGWNSTSTLLLLCVAGSFLYTGGMFLNDVCDIAFDQRHKRDRPIVSREITRFGAGSSAVLLLLLGVSLLGMINARALFCGFVLALAIVAYDLIHKRISCAPVLMAGCRFLLYLTGASAGRAGITMPACAFATGLALYIVGLSYLARGETRTTGTSAAWLIMLFAPVIINLALRFTLVALLCSLPLLFWIWRAHLAVKQNVGRAVAILLAGIVLVDLLAVSPLSLLPLIGFAVLFGAALLFQRYIPAT